MKTQNTSKVFLQGTFILAVSGVIVKVIGSLNWVFLSRILGGEGIGLYQMGFPVYLLALTLSSAGIPVAISIITAEKLAHKDYLGAKRVFTLSYSILFCTGFIFMLLMLFGAKWLVENNWIRDARAYWSIIALAPAVFIVTGMSSMRGYLQGWQKMAPTGASEIVEQFFRVVTMIALAWWLLPYGLEYGAAGASMGAAVGALMALLLLIVCVWKLHRINKTRFNYNDNIVQEKDSSIVKRLFYLALPISLSSLMLPVVANLDMLIVPARLEVVGYDISNATELFGYLTGMAIPLVNLATLFTAALAIALVPAISSSKASGEHLEIFDKTATAFRIAAAVTIPAASAIYLLAEPLARIVYNSPAAADVIQISSFAVFFLGLHQVSTGILQGLSLTKIPVITMFLAAVVKVILNWNLVALPEYGIQGAAIATCVDMGLAALINIVFIWHYTGFVVEIGSMFKVLFSTAIMVGFIRLALLTTATIGNWSLLLAVVLGTITYIPIVLKIGGLPKKDARQVPFLGGLFESRFGKYF